MSRRDRWARRRGRDAKRWVTGEDLSRRVPRRVIARRSREPSGEDPEPTGSVDEDGECVYRRLASRGA